MPLGFDSWKSLFRDAGLTVLMCISSLFGATVFVIGPVVVFQIQADIGFNDAGVAAIAATSLVGLQLTIFAGIIIGMEVILLNCLSSF